MGPNFTKPLQKQWLDYYCERIQGLCRQKIDSGLVNPGTGILDVIKDVVEDLSIREHQAHDERRNHIESLKQQLKALGHASPPIAPS